MNVQVVINPAAGREEPVLSVLNRVFREAQVDWDIAMTRNPGDGRRFAEQAVKAGFDAVAVYGGDGTVSEVANGLLDTGVPLLILPGGTGNVIAQELGVPLTLEDAAKVLANPDRRVGRVDAMQCGQRAYFLRLGVGADARMIGGAGREEKDRLGWAAYLFSALDQMREPVLAEYSIRVDDAACEGLGLTCVAANIARIGRGGVRFASDVDPTDGLLDVLFIKNARVKALATIGSALLGIQDSGESANDDESPVLRFRGSKIVIETTPVEPVHGDGDLLEVGKVEIEVRPGALSVVLPPAPASE